MKNPWLLVTFSHKTQARLKRKRLLPRVNGKPIYANVRIDLLICQIMFGLMSILMKILKLKERILEKNNNTFP